MKKIIIILSILLLGGCYDYVEIDDLLIITGMIIDYKNNEYQIITEAIENDKESNVIVFNESCKTISQCISNISKESNKKIFMSQLKVLLLTENVINNDINYYDYFLRDPKSKMNFYIFTINEDDKNKIIKLYKNNNGYPLYIRELLDFNNKTLSSSTTLSFLDLMKKRLEYGIEIVYPNIKVNEEKIYLEDLIIYSNNKIVLDDNQSVFYNLITNNINKSNIEIPCENNTFSINIDKSKSRFNWNNNIFYIDIYIDSKINNYNCNYNISDKNTINILSNQANHYINQNINKIINLAKINNYDFIGIGNYIYKHDKKYFDFENYNWNYRLNDVKINTKVNTIITSIGEIRK